MCVRSSGRTGGWWRSQGRSGLSVRLGIWASIASRLLVFHRAWPPHLAYKRRHLQRRQPPVALSKLHDLHRQPKFARAPPGYPPPPMDPWMCHLGVGGGQPVLEIRASSLTSCWVLSTPQFLFGQWTRLCSAQTKAVLSRRWIGDGKAAHTQGRQWT